MPTLAYSPFGNGHSIYPFDELFDNQVDAYVNGFNGVDAFLLWGGTDIHPSFYNESPHRFNQAPTFHDECDCDVSLDLQQLLANFNFQYESYGKNKVFSVWHRK